jgi:hypothetical protein
MKNLIPLLFIFLGLLVQAQFSNFCVDFENPEYITAVSIDSVTYPENLWQIGPPQKPGFDLVISQPNAIVTDTLNPYPANSVSSFTIMNQVSLGFYYDLVFLLGYYFVQSDSLNDFGTLEFSPDNGATWIDLISDTLYPANFQWMGLKPVLTGNSYGWHPFEMLLADIGSIFPLQIGDTVLYRFKFMTDNTFDNLGGLMFDDICFGEFIEGISETQFKPVMTTIFPNPSKEHFNISFENPRSCLFELAVYDEQSHRIITIENIGGHSMVLDASSLQPGVYFYKLTNNNLKERGWGKFVVIK